MFELVPQPIRLTYDDFCALPDDGRRYEILDGDLYMSPAPVTLHQIAVGKLYRKLGDFVEDCRLGIVFVAPYDVILGKHDVVEPDLVFVSTARRSIITSKNIQGAPDLLIEVLSPSTADRDTRDKRNIYARCGVPFYWIVDPDRRSVLELQLVGSAYAPVAELTSPATFKPTLFPGLAIELESLWD